MLLIDIILTPYFILYCNPMLEFQNKWLQARQMLTHGDLQLIQNVKKKIELVGKKD